MKRTINIKAVLILFIASTVIGVTTALVHGYQVMRNARDLLEQANQAEAEGHLDQSLENLGFYLSLNPQDGDVLARFGLLLSKLNNSPRARYNAYHSLEQALLYGADRPEVRREAARLALEQGDHSMAEEHLKILQEASPDDGELEGLQGQCQEIDGNFAAAADWYTKAVQHAPDRLDNYFRQALLLRQRLGQPEAADKLIKDMVKANSRSLEGRLGAARYYMQFGLFKEAEQDIRFVVDDLGGGSAEAFVLAAAVAQVNGDKAKCQERLENGLKQYPGNGTLSIALARLEISRGQRDRAIELLRPSLENPPDRSGELAELTAFLIDLDLVDEAGRMIERVRKGGDNGTADILAASILVRRGQWGEARALLEANKTEGHSPEWAKQADLLLGRCYEHLGNPDGQMAAYRRALETDPQGVQANRGLAFALLRQGKTNEAIDVYRKIVPQVPEMGLELARLLIQQNLSSSPKNQHWDEVEQALAKLPEELRQSADAQVVRAESLAAQDKLADAAQLLKSERTKHPENVRLWLGLASLADRQGNPAGVKQVLEEGEKQFGKRVEWKLARIRFAAKTGGTEVHKALAALESSVDDFAGEDQNRLLDSLARAYWQVDDKAAAVRLWNRLARQEPTDLGTRASLLEVAIQAGQEPEVQRLLDEIKQIEGGGGLLWSYGQAEWLVKLAADGDKSRLQEARQRVAEAGASRPTWSAVPLLEARMEEMEGRTDQALEKYLHAIYLGENQPGVIRRTVELLYQNHRFVEAQDLLRNLPLDTVKTSGLSRQAAETLLLNGAETNAPERRRLALEMARQAVPDNSTDYHDILWLGQISVMADDKPQAEKLFRRAVELNDKAPECWVTLVSFLAQTAPTRAEAAIEEARSKLPPEVAPLALAACLEVTGKMVLAQQQYENALNSRPNDPAILQTVADFYSRTGQLAKAETCLRKMVNPDPTISPLVQAQGRRHLAIVLAATGDYQKNREALTLLDVNLQSPEKSWEDDRDKAIVLATRPSSRQDAIALFERLANEKRLGPQQQFLLAQLYDTADDHSKARELMLQLLSTQGNNPQYLSYYAQSLLTQEHTSEAAFWVQKLTTVEPASWRTTRLRAEILKNQGQPAEAARLLNKFVEVHPEQQAPVAASLEKLGQNAEAEKAYRQEVATSKRPESVLYLAQFLGRQKRVQEALDLCESAWKTCPARLVAITSLSVLRSGGGTPAQFQAVDKRLAEAVHKEPEPAFLIVIQAQVQELQEHFGEAELRYREVLGLDPRNVMALNNLGWLLVIKEGNGTDALTMLNQAFDIAGPTPDLLDSRGVAYLALGKSSEAIQDLEGAVRIAPSPSSYFHLAQAYNQSNNRTAATAALHKGTDLGLAVANVHPLEREAYGKLVHDLE